MSLTVAWIGTGIMGAPMAGHVLSRGHRLRVHTRTRHKADPLLRQGAVFCASAGDAARDADVVCVCVTDTPDVERVLLTDDGVAPTAREGTVVVDHSTISPIATTKLAKDLAGRGISLLDAPVSGGDVGARNGALAIMVGGESVALERARPVLECYGKTITHCGPSGAGQFAKLVNQILVSVTLAGVSEALSFAQRAGLNLETAIAATAAGAAGSWQLSNLGPKIAAGDYRPGFMIDLLLKDLRILRESAEAIGAPQRVSKLVTDLFTAASAAGHGRDGTQAVFEVIRTP